MGAISYLALALYLGAMALTWPYDEMPDGERREAEEDALERAEHGRAEADRRAGHAPAEPAPSGHDPLGAIPLSIEIARRGETVGMQEIDSGVTLHVTLRVLLPDGCIHEVVLSAMRRCVERESGELGYQAIRRATSVDYAALRALRARIDRALDIAS